MRYESPDTVPAAAALLAEGGREAYVLAGGTDLLVQMRHGRVAPALVVDVKRIPEMCAIESTADGGFRIGAAVCGAALGEHPALARAWPGVVEAAGIIGSTQIQGRASLGGNLCNASPAADSVPALMAAGATCTVAGPAGRREVPVGSICAGPGCTTLAPGEMVVSFALPPRPPRAADAYLRFIPRTEMDIAVVGAGVDVALDGEGRCVAARVAVGAVAPTALELPEAADALVGTAGEPGALEALADAVRGACRPIDDQRAPATYRTRVAGVIARRAARTALERARCA